VANAHLSKSNQNLNSFKWNLEVDPCISLCEPQTPWIQVQIASRCKYGPTGQIPTNSEASKSLEFKFNQIWLKLGLWFLIQIPFWILKNSKEEICSLFQCLDVHILFSNFRATQDHLLKSSNLNPFEDHLEVRLPAPCYTTQRLHHRWLCPTPAVGTSA
jgi:hypothetical protein